MRDVFAKTLEDIACEDEKLVLLMAEVGYGVVESFEKKYPDRFYNTGISEQNLVLTACGMAARGFHPVAYSMSSFLPTRAFEMIKDAVCYQNLPVTLVGIGSGISYGKLGSTHHAPEEYALMNCLPNLRIIFPATGDDCRAAIKYAIQSNGPCYIGLEKCKASIEGLDLKYDSKWKKFTSECEKSSVALIAVGYLLTIAKKISYELEKKGILCTIYSAQTVKPLDRESIIEACRCKNIYVIEEHYKIGGLGAEISQYILENGLAKEINHYEVIGISDNFVYNVKDETDILNAQGINTERICEHIIKQ